MSCNRFHAEQPRMAIDDLDKIDDFHKIANDYERITEIVGILQLIRDGNTKIQPVENPLLERWMTKSKITNKYFQFIQSRLVM